MAPKNPYVRELPRGYQYRRQPVPFDIARTPGSGGGGGKPTPIPLKESEGDKLIQSIADNVDILASTIVLERGLVSRSITVGTTPVQVIDGRFRRGYIFLNPTPAVGLTATGTIFASATRATLATGNSQASPVGAASYKTMALFLDISATTGGTVQIDTQSQDPLSLNWATAQSDIFTIPSAVGTYYANIGNLGVDRSFAGAFTIGAGGGSTFSVGYVLKDGLPGGGTGIANTIYLGPNAGVNSTSGFPLTEGNTLEKFFRENTQLWAVSLIAAGVTLTIFELQ